MSFGSTAGSLSGAVDGHMMVHIRDGSETVMTSWEITLRLEWQKCLDTNTDLGHERWSRRSLFRAQMTHSIGVNTRNCLDAMLHAWTMQSNSLPMLRCPCAAGERASHALRLRVS